MQYIETLAEVEMHNSLILFLYIIEICWKKYLYEIIIISYSLITVDAVSGRVVTVGIPSVGRCADTDVRKHKE